MDTVFLLAVILLALGNNVILHRFHNRGIENLGDGLLFNAGVMAIWIPVVLILNGGAVHRLELSTLLWGAAYGVGVSVFMLAKMEAMATGPISLTQLVGSSALILTTVYGTAVWHERITVYQIAGIALLAVAMVLCVNPRIQGKLSGVWKLFAALFLLSGSLDGVIFKYFQSSDGKTQVGEMMLVAAAVSAVLLTATAYLGNAARGAARPRLRREQLWYLLSCGVVTGLYNRMNIYISGALPAAVVFPLINGSMILGAALLGRFLFREKLKPVQLVGMCAGIASIPLIGNVFG